MRRNARMKAFRAVVTVIGVLAVTAFGWGEEILQAPALRVGDWWEFQSSHERWRLTVETLDGDLYILSDSRDPKKMYYMDRNLNLVKWVDESGREGQHASLPYLRFPLDPRASWRLMPVRDRSGEAVVYVFTPKGWENVELGGRVVRALRIDVVETIRRGGAATPGAMEVVWYSPEAKQIVLHVCDCDGRPNWILVDWGGLKTLPARRGR